MKLWNKKIIIIISFIKIQSMQYIWYETYVVKINSIFVNFFLLLSYLSLFLSFPFIMKCVSQRSDINYQKKNRWIGYSYSFSYGWEVVTSVNSNEFLFVFCSIKILIQNEYKYRWNVSEFSFKCSEVILLYSISNLNNCISLSELVSNAVH